VSASWIAVSQLQQHSTVGLGPIKSLLSEVTGWSIAMKGQGYINATSTVERGFL
jgi:hypothetical protein